MKKKNFKLKLAALSAFLILPLGIFASATTEKGINSTFWSAWGGNTSYNIEGKQIKSNPIVMDKIDSSYNVIITAFIVTDTEGNYVLSFKDPGSTGDPVFSKEEVKQFIRNTKAQGRKVIVSMGGQYFHLNMKTQADADYFVEQTKGIIDEYGFEGLDLDLETDTLASIDPKIMGNAVMSVVKHYKDNGIDFWLTAAPEWCYIVPFMYGSGQWASHSLPGSFYVNLIKNIGIENFTYIWPQSYNQGPANGIAGPEKDASGYSTKVTPGDGMDKFLSGLAWAISTNEGYSANGNIGIKIPAEKLVLGIPATEGAAGGGMLYVATPALIKSAWDQMTDNNSKIAGFMNWSVDWDAMSIKKGDLSPGYTHIPWSTGIAVSEVINGKAVIEL